MRSWRGARWALSFSTCQARLRSKCILLDMSEEEIYDGEMYVLQWREWFSVRKQYFDRHQFSSAKILKPRYILGLSYFDSVAFLFRRAFIIGLRCYKNVNYAVWHAHKILFTRCDLSPWQDLGIVWPKKVNRLNATNLVIGKFNLAMSHKIRTKFRRKCPRTASHEEIFFSKFPRRNFVSCNRNFRASAPCK